MSEILSRLYLGDLKDASDVRFLREKNITGIISCCSTLDFGDLDECGIEQYRVDVEDVSAEPILQHLDGAVHFIDKHVKGPGGGVLVHCRSGVSRSATIVIAYLMQVQHMTLREAFLRVITRRPCICPNIGFMNQLVALENSLSSQAQVWNGCDRELTTNELSPRLSALTTSSPAIQHAPPSPPLMFFSPAATLSASPSQQPHPASVSNVQRLRQLGQAMMANHYRSLSGQPESHEESPALPAKPASFHSYCPPIAPVPSGVSTRAALSTPCSPARRPRRPPDHCASAPRRLTALEKSSPEGAPPTPSLSMAKYISWYTAYGKQRPPVPSLAP